MKDVSADFSGVLGTYVRSARERARLSQGQLAAAIGVNPSYIARIESGERAKPAADILQRIADTLVIDSSDLLAFLGVKPSLPEPRIYFQLKYGMGADEADVAARLIEDFCSERTWSSGTADRTGVKLMQDRWISGAVVPAAGQMHPEE